MTVIVCKGPITFIVTFQDRPTRRHQCILYASAHLLFFILYVSSAFILFPKLSLHSLPPFLASDLHWFNSKPQTPHLHPWSVKHSLLDCPQTTQWPCAWHFKEHSKHSESPWTGWKAKPLSKAPISATCHSQRKVDLDIDSVVTYV